MSQVLTKHDAKVFNDSVHGHIELHPLLVKIIDTPQFQRLRNIKQLGGAYFVFPGASHNRFEHSIGVAHLAGEFTKMLQSRQPELDITDTDVLCVQIAGLCHDLGHGPFSHLYDRMFIPEAAPGVNWKHEDASLDMFDHMVEKNEKLKKEMERYELTQEDLDFIKALIRGQPVHHSSENTQLKPGTETGRGEEKSFLYEIVANKRNGIDVDKFDYFARDCHHLGIKTNFDHRRFFMFTRVCEVDGQRHICSRDKEEQNLYDFFHIRNGLHRRAYQHKVTKNVEIMIKDALLKMKDCIKIKCSDGRMVSLIEAIYDMEAYTHLTDDVLVKILHPYSCSLSPSPSSQGMVDAEEIIKRIINRMLYQLLGEAWPEQRERVDTESLKKALQELVPKGQKEQDYFDVIVITFDYGMKEEDPIKYAYFYKKRERESSKGYKKTETQVSKLLPETFSEQVIRVYWKKDSDSQKAKGIFETWCKNRNIKMEDE